MKEPGATSRFRWIADLRFSLINAPDANRWRLFQLCFRDGEERRSTSVRKEHPLFDPVLSARPPWLQPTHPTARIVVGTTAAIAAFCAGAFIFSAPSPTSAPCNSRPALPPHRAQTARPR